MSFQVNQLNTELSLMGELHCKYQQRLAETTNLHSTELTNLSTGFKSAVADNNGLLFINFLLTSALQYILCKSHVRHATLLLNKVACLTSRVAQLLTSPATKLLDRNRLYSSSAISCSFAEL